MVVLDETETLTFGTLRETKVGDEVTESEHEG